MSKSIKKKQNKKQTKTERNIDEWN